MRGQALLAVGALTAALAAAQPAAAQGGYYASPQYTQSEQQCRNARNQRQITGALIGGVAGALLGRGVAADNTRSEGTAIGAIAGAAAGAMIGRRTAANACSEYQGYQQGAPQPYSQAPYYGGGGRNNDGSGLYGGPYQQSSYNSGRGQCDYRPMTTYDRRGRERVEQVYMCRGRDGVWREAE